MDHLESNTSYEINTRPINSTYTIVVSLSNPHISWLTVAVVCLTGAFFLGGYFLGGGNRSATLDKLDNVSLRSHDHLHEKNRQPGCYAQLATFGSLSSAKVFVEHLQQKKIIAKVIERKSDTVSGKEIIWYQVITEFFDTQDELCKVLRKLEKEEKLNDTRVIIC